MQAGWHRVRAVVIPVALAMSLTSLLAQAAGAGPQVAEISRIEEAVLAQQQWVDDAQRCPADLMAPAEAAGEAGNAGCAPGQLEACLARCTEGNAGACYGLAQRLEAHDLRAAAVGVLFQRACRLGSMSGCTNRAAERMSEEDQQSCAARTFEATCRAGDSWGCTMSARYLAGGVVVAQDFPRALRALDQACRFGLKDSACVDAIKLRIEIRRMQREAAATASASSGN